MTVSLPFAPLLRRVGAEADAPRAWTPTPSAGPCATHVLGRRDDRPRRRRGRAWQRHRARPRRRARARRGDGARRERARRLRGVRDGRRDHSRRGAGWRCLGERDVPTRRLVVEFVGARRESYRQPTAASPSLRTGRSRTRTSPAATSRSTRSRQTLNRRSRFGETITDHVRRTGQTSRRARSARRSTRPSPSPTTRSGCSARRASRPNSASRSPPRPLAAMRGSAPRASPSSAPERITDETEQAARRAGAVRRPGNPVPDGPARARILPEVTTARRRRGGRRAGAQGQLLAHARSRWTTSRTCSRASGRRRARRGLSTCGCAGPRCLHDIGKAETKRWEPGTGWTFHGHEDVGPRRLIPETFRRLQACRSASRWTSCRRSCGCTTAPPRSWTPT